MYFQFSVSFHYHCPALPYVHFSQCQVFLQLECRVLQWLQLPYVLMFIRVWCPKCQSPSLNDIAQLSCDALNASVQLIPSWNMTPLMPMSSSLSGNAPMRCCAPNVSVQATQWQHPNEMWPPENLCPVLSIPGSWWNVMSLMSVFSSLRDNTQVRCYVLQASVQFFLCQCPAEMWCTEC